MNCGRWIPILRPHLSDALVDAQALRRLRAAARYLPGDSLGVIEVRLAPAPSPELPKSEPVDLSLRLKEPPQGEWVEHLSPPHLRRFLCHGWKQVGHPAPVSYIWLEFDLDHEPRRLPVPLVCARLRERVESGWLVDTLLPALHGRSLDAAQRRQVRRSVDEIPDGIRLLYVFSLLSRPGAAVRLELYGQDVTALIGYLGRVSQQAALQAAELAPLLRDADRYHLSFDVGASIGSRTGIECGFFRLPHREPRWSALFDRLVTQGLCSAEKRDAVFEWPGYDTLWTAAGRWPEEERTLGHYVVRCLSHVKLVSRPEHAPEAKAYLSFQPLEPRSAQS